MISPLRRLAIVFVMLVGALLPATADENQSTLVINLTTDDVWSSQMALGFARRVQEDGGTVVVFLNVRAISLAMTDVPQHTGAGSGETAHQTLAAILADGGRVFLCPGCTEQAGLNVEGRLDGIELGGPEFRAIVMAPGTRIMSY